MSDRHGLYITTVMKNGQVVSGHRSNGLRERLQHLPDRNGALGELARDALDAQLGWPGEFPALLLHELQHRGRVEGRMRHELDLDEFGSGVDACHAERPPEDAQPVAL